MARATKTSKTPVSNVFGSAPVIAVAPSAANGKQASETVKGLEELASLVAVYKMIEGFKTEVETRIKAALIEKVIVEGMKSKTRPANFKGEEGFGTASMQLREKGTALGDEAIAAFNLHEIALEHTTLITEGYIFSEAYTSDHKTMAKIAKEVGPLLEKMQDERGPIILRQEGKIKTTVAEAGLAQIFALTEPTVVRELVAHAFTPVIVPRLKSPTDLAKAIQNVERLYKADVEETEKKKNAA